MVTIGEMAAVLGVSVRTIWRKIHRGKFPRGVMVNGAMVWDEDDMKTLIGMDFDNVMGIKHSRVKPRLVSERDYASSKGKVVNMIFLNSDDFDKYIDNAAALISKVSGTIGFSSISTRRIVARKIIMDFLENKTGSL